MLHRCRIALGVVIVCLIGVARAAEPDLSTTYEIKIAAQPLASALLEFSAQTHLQIMTLGADVRELKTTGLSGRMTVREGLEKLLAGSGLSFKLMGDSTVGLVRDSKQSSSTAADAPPRIALAAQAPDTTAAREPDAESPALEEIIVTAQKRAERLIDTPQSVTALSADALAKLGATQFRDFANTVPGLTFTTVGAGQTSIALRGVTVGLDVGPTVGVYVDDVPYGSSSSFAAASGLALDVGLFDMQRIEVLRGPQGTLYGASTMGGLLKYVSRRPNTGDFGLDMRLGVSSTHEGGTSYDGAMMVNAPIAADKAALRASAFYSRDGGYIDNITLGKGDVNDAEIYGARADLLITATDALTIRLGGFLQNIAREGNAAADFAPAGTPLAGELEQRRSAFETFDQQFRLASGVVTYDFGPVTLTSISSYQTMEAPWLTDFTAFFGLPGFSAVGYVNDISTQKLTQEVRLSSNEGDRLEWLVGAFHTHERSDNEQSLDLRDMAGNPVPNTLLFYSAPSRYEESAGFANVTWHFTDQLDVSGGLRYARNRQSFTQIGSGPFGAGLNTPTGRASEDVTTYLANARYHFSSNALAYLRYATGYRPGGPNFVANDLATGQPLGPTTFDSDRLKSYEVGYKMESADRRFGVDVAGYSIDWSNIQVISIRGGFGFKVNARGGATVQGSELTLTARPIEALTLTGAFAWQDAEMSEADALLGVAEGERLPNVPRFTAALNTDYELAKGGLQPTVGATVRYVSDRTASFDASASFPQYRLPSYTTVDLRSGLTLGSVALQLYVHNLLDERGQISAVTNFGPPQVSILQPRTVGLSAFTQF